jgi:hypothetical protein
MAITTSVPHANGTGGNGYNAVTWGTEELGHSRDVQLGDVHDSIVTGVTCQRCELS